MLSARSEVSLDNSVSGKHIKKTDTLTLKTEIESVFNTRTCPHQENLSQLIGFSLLESHQGQCWGFCPHEIVPGTGGGLIYFDFHGKAVMVCLLASD